MAGALVVKVIKPQRFKEDKLRLALLSGMKEAQKGMLTDFQATTKTWKHKPKFEVAKSIAMAQSPTVHVITTDRIYGYVNDGTKPHPIFAGIYTGLSNKKALSFRSGKYHPKTRPRVISSTPGGASGPKIARPYVEHPGTKARKFDETIQKKWTPRFKRLMEQAMSRAAKASGHGIP